MANLECTRRTGLKTAMAAPIMLPALSATIGAGLATPEAHAQQARPAIYALGPMSQVQEGVPRGQILGPFEHRSRVFAGTVRRYWIYVPHGYDAANPPNLLVFQDGQRATNPDGSLRVPVVLDNLISSGLIGPTLGVFVTPGNLSRNYPNDLGMRNPDHRAQEYDALNDAYARMLLDELLPVVARDYRFTMDPRKRVIGGTSSGAICAFTVAWHRPDAFQNVISFIGSYTSIGYRPATRRTPFVPGGDTYPGQIRKSPIRPLRIFLQDGRNDLDNEHGNWFLANQQMLAALHWANAHADAASPAGPRYQVDHIWGDGGHSDDHGGSLLPHVLAWMLGNGAAPSSLNL